MTGSPSDSSESHDEAEPGDQDDSSQGWWTRINPNERGSVVWACAWFFLMLFGYFMVEPVRATMATIGGIAELPNLFLYTFLAMLLAVPVYSSLVARLPRRWLVRVVFHFFAASLLGFSVLMTVEAEEVQTWTARAFFVWVSVFGVFQTSVFWSVLADVFDSRQGRRLFGLIASGGTAGAITGSLLTSQIAGKLSTSALLLIPVFIIELGLMCAWRLERHSKSVRSIQADTTQVTSKREGEATGGGLWAGITHVLASPYLLSICVFIFFVQAFGTQLYFSQVDIVSEAIQDTGRRTELFAYINFGTQALTLFVQAFVTGAILRRLGVSAALIVLPIVYGFAFTALAIYPSLAVLIIARIVSRTAVYGVTVPSREVLFTVVSREDKYKSKSFIDTVVIRGGDTLASRIFGSLTGTLGLGLNFVNLLALPVIAVWAATAWRLGRRQSELARSEHSQ